MSVSYSRERESSLYLQPYDKDIMGKFLFDKEDIEGKEEALYTIWNHASKPRGHIRQPACH